MMPDRLFDAGPGAGVASVPVSHAQFAAACLIARYGPGPGVTDVPMMLAAMRRSRLPWPIPPDVGALMFLYGDLYSDWVQFSSLTAILAGLGDERRAARRSGPRDDDGDAVAFVRRGPRIARGGIAGEWRRARFRSATSHRRR